jgi:flagellar FliL protein
MSAAAAADPKAKPAAKAEPTAVAAETPSRRRFSFKLPKKKLIIFGSALALLLAAGGGAAVFVLKKRAAAAAAAAAEEGGAAPAKDEAQEAKVPKADLKHAPAFAPLDPFTVNLADREAERYAQVGITLELTDAKAGDLLKAYMPAIRNNILLVLASKTAAQMMDHDGKLQLAGEIRAAALKPLGYDLKAISRQGGAEEEVPPVKAVHFSNFIIQ